MSLNYICQVPSAEEIKELYPMSEQLVKVKQERDNEIKKIFTGESDKFLAIIGPFSADNEDALLVYITRLDKVQEKI